MDSFTRTFSRKSLKHLGRMLGILFCLGPGHVLAAEDEEENEADGAIFGLGWLDQTQLYASDSADALANQLDRFFGVPRSDLEAAYSSLRLTVSNNWSESEFLDPGVSLRGNVHLPRINERLSLIFSEDEGDGSSYYGDNRAILRETPKTRVNLQLNVLDNNQDRLDFRLGLGSSFKGKASVRYRHDTELTRNLVSRLTETVSYVPTDGFGSKTRFQLDQILSSTSLLRWINDVEVEEESSGVEWSSSLSYGSIQSDTRALTYYARVNGFTQPVSYRSSYDLGIRLRQNLYQPWLFIEVEPGYSWQKDEAHAPRDGFAFVILRVEMAIGSSN
ncbi:MAG: hypothetical protein RQ899_05365 [Pseudomonadales bacterium]|nr:hypothetical protein [Pseudomonadales bacterium]